MTSSWESEIRVSISCIKDNNAFFFTQPIAAIKILLQDFLYVVSVRLWAKLRNTEWTNFREIMTGHNCCRSWLVTFCGVPDHNQGPYGFKDIYRKCILSHWGRVTHLCVGNLTIIGSDNGLSPGRRQAITWTNVGMLLIGPIGTNFSEMLI